MQKTLHVRARVQSGGRIEIVDEGLSVGEDVDVVISPAPPATTRSAYQIIAEGPGKRSFKTAKDVDDYIKEERASWDR